VARADAKSSARKPAAAMALPTHYALRLGFPIWRADESATLRCPSINEPVKFGNRVVADGGI